MATPFLSPFPPKKYTSKTNNYTLRREAPQRIVIHGEERSLELIVSLIFNMTYAKMP